MLMKGISLWNLSAVPSYKTILNKYVKDVVSGNYPSPLYVQQACKRHLKDLRDKRFVFDVDAGGRTCRFLELLPHVKGQWSRRGETLVLQPWQIFLIMELFGWKDRVTGLRKFSSAYIEVPRKNGKSFLASGIGLYMLTSDGEHGAEVYSAGKTRDQARIVFDVARQQLIRLGQDSRNALKVKVEAHKIKDTGRFGIFLPVANDHGSLDGKNPHCAVIDELHAHQTSDVIESLTLGMSSREQPILFVITTAGSNKDGVCWNMRMRSIRILSGEKGCEDNATFAMIWTPDAADDVDTEECWIKCNPNYGVSILPDNFRASYVTAKADAASLSSWQNKKLNVWSNTSAPWLRAGVWDKSAHGEITPEQFAADDGYQCVIGVDLSQRIDLSAVSLVFWRGVSVAAEQKDEHGVLTFAPTDNEYVIFSRSFIPESRAIERASDGYAEWRKGSSIADLVVCKGKTIDYIEIENTIIEWCDKYNVNQVGIDPWQASQTTRRLEDSGITCVPVNQNVKNLSPALREVEASLYAGRLMHTGDPCLAWQVSAIEVFVSQNGSIYPRKARKDDPRLRIDAGMATLIAFSQIIQGMYVPKDKSWDSGGWLESAPGVSMTNH